MRLRLVDCRFAVEQRNDIEQPAGFEMSEDVPVAARSNRGDIDDAPQHDEQCIGGFALAADQFAPAVAAHDALRDESVEHPLFWERAGGGWQWRGMFEMLPLPPSWPVYVSHAEAEAYAKWSGARLPTEAEWQRAAIGVPEPGAQHGFFDFERWDPYPVNAFPSGRSSFGVEGLIANGWEWTIH